jgi:hypothetical protein
MEIEWSCSLLFYGADTEFAFDVVEMGVIESVPIIDDMYYNM